ncbi:Glutamine-dependent NAD(+) synthetase [subsurface metagenome]
MTSWASPTWWGWPCLPGTLPPGSLSDAKLLAKNLGIKLLTIPIEKIFKAYLDTLAGAFKGVEPNVAEENIQARIRGNILMALSNKFGWLVLPTGNKSEMATGYTTLSTAREAFIQNKKIEWENYRAQVTEYELKKYLPIL